MSIVTLSPPFLAPLVFRPPLAFYSETFSESLLSFFVIEMLPVSSTSRPPWHAPPRPQWRCILFPSRSTFPTVLTTIFFPT